MNRKECELAIFEKCKEILDIYHQYVPDGMCLDISFRKRTDGNDFGDWNTQVIEFKNSTYQTLMMDGTYGAYECHTPLDFKSSYDLDTDTEKYQEIKKKWEDVFGEGEWDKEVAEYQRMCTEDIPERGISGKDSEHYNYMKFLEKYGIEPLYDDVNSPNRLLMIEDMDEFKCSTRKNDGMKEWKEEHEV